MSQGAFPSADINPFDKINSLIKDPKGPGDTTEHDDFFEEHGITKPKRYGKSENFRGGYNAVLKQHGLLSKAQHGEQPQQAQPEEKNTAGHQEQPEKPNGEKPVKPEFNPKPDFNIDKKNKNEKPRIKPEKQKRSHKPGKRRGGPKGGM